MLRFVSIDSVESAHIGDRDRETGTGEMENEGGDSRFGSDGAAPEFSIGDEENFVAWGARDGMAKRSIGRLAVELQSASRLV